MVEAVAQRRPNTKIADLHQDLSAIYEERLHAGRLNLARQDPRFPLGSVLDMYAEGPEKRHGTKTLSSNADALTVVQVLVGNLFPNPEREFAREYKLHMGVYRRLFAERPDRFTQFSTAPQLREALEDPTKTATMLSLEGIYRWNRNLNVLGVMWNDGIRSIMPVHNGDNALATGHKTSEKSGLTALGRDFIREADDIGFILDWSHASTATANEGMDLLKNRPSLISHTGSRTISPHETRAAEDSVAIRVAQSGGIVGVAPMSWLVELDEHQATPESYFRALEHYIEIFDRAGIANPYRRVAYGTDYDGMGPASVIKGMETILSFVESVTAEMDKRGYESPIKEAIQRQNAINFLLAGLPQ